MKNLFKIRFTNTKIPVPILIVAFPFLLKDWQDAKFLVFLIQIRKEHFNNEPLIIHEMTHAKQFWTKGLFIFAIRYWLIHDVREDSEIEAYGEQALLIDETRRVKFINYAASLLATEYNLKRTKHQYMTAIEKYIKNKTG